MNDVKLWKIEEPAKLIEMNLTADSLDDLSEQIPGGVYSTFRTYRKMKALHLQHHFLRLESSATILGEKLNLDENNLRQAMRRVLTPLPDQDYRLRLSISLGGEKPEIYLSLEVLHTLPPEVYLAGTKVITLTGIERKSPKAKATAFIHAADPIRKRLPAGVNEAVMIDRQGVLLEGLSSNFFAIREGKVRTAGEGVLEGITRAMVLEGVSGLGIPIEMRGVTKNDLPDLEECFITSASRGVLPVVQVDDLQIGKGKPGPLTRAITDQFQKLLETNLEDI